MKDLYRAILMRIKTWLIFSMTAVISDVSRTYCELSGAHYNGLPDVSQSCRLQEGQTSIGDQEYRYTRESNGSFS